MSDIRTLSTLGRAAREEAGVKVRQPLASLVVRRALGLGFERLLAELSPLLAAELNVKRIEFRRLRRRLRYFEARPNFRTLGKKFGKETPARGGGVAALSSAELLAFERGEKTRVATDNQTHDARSRRCDGHSARVG